MRRDIASAYLVTASRLGSWLVVSAIVYRYMGLEAFALLALIRATIGLLNYTSLGLAPAMIKLLAEAAAPSPRPAIPIEASAEGASDAAVSPPSPIVLSYGIQDEAGPSQEIIKIYKNGEGLALLLGGVGCALIFFYAFMLSSIHNIPREQFDTAQWLAVYMGIGVVFRLLSEPPAGLLQVRGKIVLDNLIVCAAEIFWAAMVWENVGPTEELVTVGALYCAANLLLFLARSFAARLEVRGLAAAHSQSDLKIIKRLLGFGLFVSFAQLADFLYAPVDLILINRLINPQTVGIYAPAVQIDSGLLLLVSALGTVLLPKTAIAHAAGDWRTVRRYYIRGTLASLALLLAAGVGVWIISPLIFKLWLGDEMRPTQAILPLVLIHTIVGGSGMVGRSILLAVGKVKPFMISVLIAGIANVILSYCFVRFLDLGLRGIILGTIIVVVVRCAIWMPWYVLRVLREMK